MNLQILGQTGSGTQDASDTHRPSDNPAAPGACSATSVACPLCGPADRTLAGRSNGFPIVRCQGCGLMYVGECPEVAETLDYFRDEHVCDEDAARQAYVFRRKHQLRREAARLRKLQPQGGRLLDVGTATGLFLAQFRNDPAWEVEGVEPSQVSAEFARQKFGLKIHQGYLQDLQYKAEEFDVVCSLDAFLCHREPAEDMLEFARILRPGGLLAIEIPGHSFRLLNGALRNRGRKLENSLRLNAGVNYFYFTRPTLTELARRAGLEFVASYPEAMPRASNKFVRVAQYACDAAAGLLYRMTGGALHIAAKEFCVFRKPAAVSSDTPSSSDALRRAA